MSSIPSQMSYPPPPPLCENNLSEHQQVLFP